MEVPGYERGHAICIRCAHLSLCPRLRSRSNPLPRLEARNRAISSTGLSRMCDCVIVRKRLPRATRLFDHCHCRSTHRIQLYHVAVISVISCPSICRSDSSCQCHPPIAFNSITSLSHLPFHVYQSVSRFPQSVLSTPRSIVFAPI